MEDAFIVAAARTPVGKFGGVLKDLPAQELGARVISAILERVSFPAGEIDEVIMGNVLQAGLGMNPARQAALLAGLPVECPAYTINKVCGSSLKAVALAAQAVQTEECVAVVAGGMENMSRAPFLIEEARWGHRMGDAALVDTMVRDGLSDPMSGEAMGSTAETLAEHYHISREQQDRFALESQQKTASAQRAGRFHEEIVPVLVPQKKNPSVRCDADEFPRPNTTLEVLSALRPAFKKEGTVTAGNASGINDGAAAMLVVSGGTVKAKGLAPLARVVSSASAGVAPERMGIGPVPAIRKALQRAGCAPHDIDLFEINEAFAAQSLAVIQELGIDRSRLNVNGGAIAMGHPIGASGARVLVSLLYALNQRGLRRGVAALCIGGGQGIAMVVERE